MGSIGIAERCLSLLLLDRSLGIWIHPRRDLISYPLFIPLDLARACLVSENSRLTHEHDNLSCCSEEQSGYRET